ncbi:hypothetical protein QCA50_019119 [Cerrena zonata]|uniref:Uncharacterized protein n=1 Tax=Cerrena zonata TaxID=2478898 RepID=A0AAW0FG79_9APHY
MKGFSLMYLFTKAEAVEDANFCQIVALNSPCAHIKAKHDGGADSAKAIADDTAGFDSEVVVARGAKVMITRTVWQETDMLFLFINNPSYLNILGTLGLVNGVTGTIEDVIWQEGSERSDLPIAVLVSCKTYSGPTLWHTEPQLGFPAGIPVIPITAIRSTSE